MGVDVKKRLLILGTRGIPARHGGFETFAEGLALYLVERGWDVGVYCQVSSTEDPGQRVWRGVRRVPIFVAQTGAFGTIVFDLLSVLHAIRQPGLVLTLGYNTAMLSVLHRLAGQVNVMNMDGVEWRRPKWSTLQRIWLFCNEWFGARLANHLVADHPEIRTHLLRHTRSDKITVIPYGAARIDSASIDPVLERGLVPGKYAILIARPEPENSILEIVRAYGKVESRTPLVVLGDYSDADSNEYQRAVIAEAGTNIRFLGAIYDKDVLRSLRRHAGIYLHGHTVGGTNPSLVEAMGAGNPVVAHDNPFNRWVLGDAGVFFRDEVTLKNALKRCMDPAEQALLAAKTHARHLERFQLRCIHEEYEQVLEKYVRTDDLMSSRIGDT